MNKFVYPICLGMLLFPLLTVFHECGHYLVALAFNADPQLYFSYVRTRNLDQLTPIAGFCIKAGGPLVDTLWVTLGLLWLRRSSPSEIPSKTDWLALVLVQRATAPFWSFGLLLAGSVPLPDEVAMSLLAGLSKWTLPSAACLIGLSAVVVALRALPRGYRLLPFGSMHFGCVLGLGCVSICLQLIPQSAGSAFSDPRATARAAAVGETALRAGEYEKAVKRFTKAITKDDRNPGFYSARGNALFFLGKSEDALKDYDTAINKLIAHTGDLKDKRLAYLFYNRGQILERLGRIRDALADVQKTTELDPSYPDAHNYLAWILATHPDASVRDPAKALEYALVEAERTKMESANVLDTLAAAYAANGRFEEACRHQREAAAMTKSEPDKGESLERLRLYEQNKPFIRPSN